MSRPAWEKPRAGYGYITFALRRHRARVGYLKGAFGQPGLPGPSAQSISSSTHTYAGIRTTHTVRSAYQTERLRGPEQSVPECHISITITTLSDHYRDLLNLSRLSS